MQNLLTLQDIFKDRIFRIPDYQRGYSWEEEHLQDFWDDLENISENGEHYTGVITVQKPKNDDEKLSWINEFDNIEDIDIHDESNDIFICKNDDFTITSNLYGKNKFPEIQDWLNVRKISFFIKISNTRQYEALYIVDGQQRLTTILILLSLIRNRFENTNIRLYNEIEERFIYHEIGNNKVFLFGYAANIPSHHYLKSKIFNNPIKKFDKDKDLYTSRIKNARDFFNKKLEIKNNKQLEVLYTKIERQLKFNFYEIDTSLNIFTVFETLNNRGKKLSTLEKLKNRLIFLSTQNKLQNPYNPTYYTSNDEFKKAKQNLREKINETWKTVYKYLGRNSKKLLSDDEFLRIHWIMYFNHDREREFKDFSTDLLKNKFTLQNLDNFLIVNKEKITNPNYKITSNTVNIINYLDCLSSSVKWWYYMSFLDSKGNEIDISLRKWLMKIKRIRKGTYFYPIILALLNKDYQINEKYEILKKIERHNFLIFVVTNANSNANRSLFWETANQFYRGKLNIDKLNIKITQNTEYDWRKRIGFYSLDRFSDHIHDHKNNKKRFYDWGEREKSNYIKYFLFEYEQFCQNEKNEKISWDNFDIRQIFPERVAKELDTEICWNNFKIEGLGRTDKLKLCYSLGNLLLVKNLSQGENCFLKLKYQDNYSSYSEKELFNKYSNWNIEDIYKRGVCLLKWAEERWDFDISDKRKILLPYFQTKYLPIDE